MEGFEESEYAAVSANDETSDGLNALNLKWVLGFNKDIYLGVHSLISSDRTEIFYTAAHTGVIYNTETGEQKLLQGHCNKISCAAVSEDKKWIITADSGNDSMLVIWDSYSATPVKTIFTPHPTGTAYLDISDSATYIVTLSSSLPQEMIVWNWSLDTDDDSELIVASTQIVQPDPAAEQLHHSVRFNTQNPMEIATNNDKYVIFWQWDEETKEFVHSIPNLRPRDFFKQSIQPYTQTLFMPGSEAVTGTTDGQIIIWDQSLIPDEETHPDERKPIKIVQLFNASASILVLHDTHLVVGFSDGCIRFYDQRFTIEAWFEHINANNILSISFSDLPPRQCTENMELGDIGVDTEFACPDFIVASDNAKIIEQKSTYFEEVPPLVIDGKWFLGETLVQGLVHPLNAVTAHPKRSLIALAGGCENDCYIYIWDYKTRQKQKFTVPPNKPKLVKQVKNEPLCLEFSPDGEYLCAGFAYGKFAIIDPNNIHVEKQVLIKYTENPKSITNIIFSDDSQAMATMDQERCVSLFKLQHRKGREDLPIEWTFCGAHNSHTKRINAISFGVDVKTNELRLFSVADDRTLVEYDTNSVEETQLQIKSSTKIEQEACPSACIWNPVNSTENLLLTVNSEYKIKLWNVDDKKCRQTCLGPTYGGHLNNLKLLTRKKFQSQTEDQFLAYSTEEKIVGLLKLPVDGNPNKSMGMIAHPNKVTDITISGDRKFLFTSGGDDLCLNMWYIDTEAIDNQVLLGGEDPFTNMVEGGRDGAVFTDMKDYFYYSQIRSKVENTTKARKLEGSIPLEEIASIMRALDYYPSEQEIENMKNEVRYSTYGENEQLVSNLDQDILLKLYVNHRPVFGLDKTAITEAFYLLSDGNETIAKEDFVAVMTGKGETMTDRELKGCLTSLMTEEEGDIEDYLPDMITIDFLLDKLLDLEENWDEEEDEEDEQGMPSA